MLKFDHRYLLNRSNLGVLITGAGVQTTFAGQSQMDEYIVIGDCDSTNVLRGLSVEVDGTPFFSIANSAVLMGAWAKWYSQVITGGILSLIYKVGTGAVGRNTTYRFTNDGATTPTVKVYSDSKNGVPFIVTTKGINPSSYDDFRQFSVLLLETPGNVSSVEISFADGHKATMTIEEVDSLYAMKYPSETNGRLNGASVIDNTDQSIQAVRIFTTSSALTVLIGKVPDAAFKAMRQG